MTDKLYQAFLNSEGICTDSRNVGKGTIFFALKGSNFNGNLYAGDALDKGAAMAVVDEEQYVRNDNYLLVDDVLAALQGLARHHRRTLGIPILGITGSNGKTTTKELIQAVLSRKFKTYATHGNLNNHIGVPLTLLSMDEQTELGIVEMGANKVGDIAELCSIAEPSHGVITNIGKAHIEGFGGIEGVLRGKSELFQWLRQTGGQVFINSHQEMLLNMAKRFESPVCFGRPEDDFSCELIDLTPFINYRTREGQRYETHLLGAYNFQNIEAALCIGQYFGVADTVANEAIAQYVPNMNRSQIIDRGGLRIILDAYNANPTSVKAAIDNVKQMKASAKGVILGDMLELGPEEEEEHYKVGLQLSGTDIDLIIFIGPRMMAAARACPEAHYFESRDEAAEYLHSHAPDNMLLLLKASRGMSLEKLLEALPG